MATEDQNVAGCEEWLLLRVGSVPRTSLGWFRCGVGFYNKKESTKAIQCFEKSVQLDPLNVFLV
jgi:predicted TPR repeat methyltransferase